MIDARIRDAYETPDGVIIELEPRRTAWGWSCTGQRELLIRHPTWMPQWGLAVTGNLTETIIIGSNPPHHYKHVEATTLEEVK